MKSDKLADAIGMVGDDLIDDAHTLKDKRKHNYKLWSTSVAAILVIAIGIGALFGNNSHPSEIAYANQVKAEYPQMPQYSPESDEWYEYTRLQRTAYSDAGYNLDEFLVSTLPEFLNNKADKNVAYSPLNLYMALSMLAEISGGESRQQILDLMNVSDIQELQKQAGLLWNAHYRDDGLSKTILASSLWLNQKYDYNKTTLESLADNYYASSFWGEMGSAEFEKVLHNWLNTQTNGLLEDEIQKIHLTEETILSLATTLYFQAEWQTNFSEKLTANGIFHSSTGDVNCNYMHSRTNNTYYWSENFSATFRHLKNDNTMYFILPDDDVTVNDLLSDSELMEFMLAPYEWENQKYLKINLSVPKFDITSQMDLKEDLKSLGVTNVFSSETADFTPLLNAENYDAPFVSKVQHDVRVMIDEKGCSAAAYTLIGLESGTMTPEDEIDFVLDRPFMFVITSNVGLPVFVGVVNTP